MSDSVFQMNRRGLLAGLGALGSIPLFQSSGWAESKVFMDYSQVELDRNYTQGFWADASKVTARRNPNSELAIEKLGEPEVLQYGPTQVETLELYRARHQESAPIQIFIHGGSWRHSRPQARGQAHQAPKYVMGGAHFIALNFANVMSVGLDGMADQIRRAIVWVYENAESFDGDPDRIFISGRSSGAHLTGVMVVTDWNRLYGVPPDIIKGAVCSSGMFDLKPVRLSVRSSFVPFTDEIEEAYSPMRHLDKVGCPVIVGYGEYDTPEFRRQSQEFAEALDGIDRLQELIVVAGANHPETPMTFANPFEPFGDASLRQMGIDPFMMWANNRV